MDKRKDVSRNRDQLNDQQHIGRYRRLVKPVLQAQGDGGSEREDRQYPVPEAHGAVAVVTVGCGCGHGVRHLRYHLEGWRIRKKNESPPSSKPNDIDMIPL